LRHPTNFFSPLRTYPVQSDFFNVPSTLRPVTAPTLRNIFLDSVPSPPSPHDPTHSHPHPTPGNPISPEWTPGNLRPLLPILENLCHSFNHILPLGSVPHITRVRTKSCYFRFENFALSDSIQSRQPPILHRSFFSCHDPQLRLHLPPHRVVGRILNSIPFILSIRLRPSVQTRFLLHPSE